MAWISHQTLNHFETLIKQFEEIQQKYQTRTLRKKINRLRVISMNILSVFASDRLAIDTHVRLIRLLSQLKRGVLEILLNINYHFVPEKESAKTFLQLYAATLARLASFHFHCVYQDLAKNQFIQFNKLCVGSWISVPTKQKWYDFKILHKKNKLPVNLNEAVKCIDKLLNETNVPHEADVKLAQLLNVMTTQLREHLVQHNGNQVNPKLLLHYYKLFYSLQDFSHACKHIDIENYYQQALTRFVEMQKQKRIERSESIGIQMELVPTNIHELTAKIAGLACSSKTKPVASQLRLFHHQQPINQHQEKNTIAFDDQRRTP